MNEKSLYRYTLNDKAVVVRAEGIRDVRRHALEAMKFDSRKATADDVLEFTSAGGKVVDVPSAE